MTFSIPGADVVKATPASFDACNTMRNFYGYFPYGSVMCWIHQRSYQDIKEENKEFETHDYESAEQIDNFNLADDVEISKLKLKSLTDLLEISPVKFQCSKPFNTDNYAPKTISYAKSKFENIQKKVSEFFLKGFMPETETLPWAESPKANKGREQEMEQMIKKFSLCQTGKL